MSWGPEWPPSAVTGLLFLGSPPRQLGGPLPPPHPPCPPQDFVVGLSILLRGTVHEKLKWAFNLYDINKDGYITKEVAGGQEGVHPSAPSRPAPSWLSWLPALGHSNHWGFLCAEGVALCVPSPHVATQLSLEGAWGRHSGEDAGLGPRHPKRAVSPLRIRRPARRFCLVHTFCVRLN